MKVISTNVGNAVTFLWNGKEERTGIFKYPVDKVLSLEKEDVANDTVIDRKHHGGIHKACYLFASDHYPYWKKLYPHLDWDWGMFGENLTVEGLNESVIRIGDIYKVGTALVQISQPREPCYKLGVRFKNQSVLKQFIHHGHPGTYVRVLNTGKVRAGDTLELIEQSQNTLTVQQFYNLLYDKKKDTSALRLAINNSSLPEYKRERLKKYL
ncbi:MOSC domain-containing protein [Costertonia aggregata]|uniref:MOSC domain-containing protein n=1 Tax=Costertonia aggregata TaxID=343403 RepID=A0A7H9AL72_9FLAO|nr:MOSC domain-containing protein [Costertonia aggregata]QLG44210.1 MOSC domain-containing protein [Costertonia aggregata]